MGDVLGPCFDYRALHIMSSRAELQEDILDLPQCSSSCVQMSFQRGIYEMFAESEAARTETEEKL